MVGFDYYSPTRLMFGRGKQALIGKEVKKYANTVLLHYGGASIKKSGLYDQVIASLKEENITYYELGGVRPNPTLPLIYKGIEICKRNAVQLVLAVGGGSVIDSAKAIAMGAVYDGDVWDFFQKDIEAQTCLPVATILTIPAAGSESSKNSVITNEELGYKTGSTSEFMRPVFSILNPELCYTLPKNQMAYGVSDIIAHMMERYFTNTPHVDFSDRLLEGGIKSVMYNARKLLDNYEDYDTWANIMWAGCVGHNGILGVGRVEDWASHGIEHELSALYDIPHGAGLAIVFPAWMRYVNHVNKKRFIQFATRIMEVDMAMEEEDAVIEEAIRRLENFYRTLGLPTHLSDLETDADGNATGIKVTEDDIQVMAKKSIRYGIFGGFMPMEEKDVCAILQMAQ